MTERLPQPEPLSDGEKIDVGIRYAELNATVIPDSTARLLAMAYHDGQASALYSLGSCGAIDGQRVLRELSATVGDDEDIDTEREIGSLMDYAYQKGSRGPIEGWHRLTSDDLPPIVHIDTAIERLIGEYLGNYHTLRELADDRLVAVGVFRAIGHLVERIGESFGPFINVDVDGYARSLHNDFVFMPLPDGTIDAYWRNTE